MEEQVGKFKSFAAFGPVKGESRYINLAVFFLERNTTGEFICAIVLATRSGTCIVQCY